jgi:hypothetical protein
MRVRAYVRPLPHIIVPAPFHQRHVSLPPAGSEGGDAASDPGDQGEGGAMAAYEGPGGEGGSFAGTGGLPLGQRGQVQGGGGGVRGAGTA